MTARGKQQQHALLPSSLISSLSINPATFFSNRPVRLVFVGSLLLCLCILLSDLFLQSNDDASAAPAAASPAVAAAVASGRYPTRVSPHDTLRWFREEARRGRPEGGGGSLGGWQQGDRGEPVRVLQAEIARYREGQGGVIATGVEHDGGRGDGGGLAGGGTAQSGEMDGGGPRGEEGGRGEADGAAMAAFIPSLSDADGDTSEEGSSESAADGPPESAASSAEEQASALLAADPGAAALLSGSIPTGPLSAIKEKMAEINRQLDDARSALAQSEKEKAQLVAELAKMRDSGGGAGGGAGGGGAAGAGVVAAAAGGSAASAAARSPGFGLCMATTAEMRRYLNYTKRAACPDDWRFVEHLRFARNCLHLPRRRCRATALTPPDFQEYTLGFPAAVFAKEALRDENVRWGEGMRCGSYKECVEVSKEEGVACKGCFDVESEQHWWDKSVSGTIPLKAFLKLKPPGALRIGLDVGGGTGGFAAVMALHNITIITTGMNTDGGREDEKAVPYMQTIAQRGLVPLYLPHSAPLPFFDNTLDLIHTLNSVKYPHLAEFEAMLFEWDRVVRPGGLWWIEMFYAPDREMKAYVQALEAFGYGKRYWSLGRKQRASERKGNHFVLTCVLEKPLKLQG
ncbi:unnamed protein product [Closterium sp. NIES-64]|nr:unnamed protein product [Closterium sp. NIES-64]